ncbi:hypothetical protein HBO07_25560 [Pseudomonas proteolytica]|uniref:hypothetical protein n=1 Tax=Pseudomonas proteolytica TaxID=219574 RepID=UPI0014755379|nr:hypothetical protein [Pseudomonas proteolytica]NMZ14643.1 hypothetical protein [Pseudomonas proteolytica]
MLNQDQLAAALKAFGEAVPAGTKLHLLKVTPSVGYTDTEAKPVLLFALADSEKDVQRLSQVIARGIQAFETEPGLTASLLRDQPQPDVFAQAAELALEKVSPRLVTITQDKAQLERLYPKGGDGKSVSEAVHEEIDLNTVVEHSFAAGQGVVTLSASMTDKQILTLIKGACTWSKGKAFQVIPAQAE